MDLWSLANLTNSMVYRLKRLLEEIINKMNCQILGDVYSFSTFLNKRDSKLYRIIEF